MLIIEGLQKEFGLTPVLKDVSFAIGEGQKVALVGRNGSGKSTLLKILAGVESFDHGMVRLNPGARIGYVPQDMVFPEQVSMADFLNDSTRDDVSRDRRMNAFLRGFGFHDADLGKRMSELSGGQKRKAYLVRVLLDDPDCLLLDEPTNDLDLASIIFLERFLKTAHAAVIVASHDRRFLDGIAKKVLEINHRTHGVILVGGSYSDYVASQEKKRARQWIEYEEQTGEIARLQSRVKELKRKGQLGNVWEGNDRDKLLRDFKRDRSKRSGKRAKAIERRLDQMERIDKPFEEKPLEFLFGSPVKGGNRDVIAEDLVAGYPSGFSLQSVSFSIPYGSRIAFIGANGLGKTTLIRTISGEVSPLEGSVRIGSGIRFGNLMQEHTGLDRQATPFDILRNAGIEDERCYFLIDLFGIGTTHAHEFVESLSPGQRVRLILALCSARQVNAFILDEPTNHLDLDALSALESALKGISGTVIAVSHDREFIEHLKPDMIYCLNDDGSIALVSDYQAYLEEIERRQQETLDALGAF